MGMCYSVELHFKVKPQMDNLLKSALTEMSVPFAEKCKKFDLTTLDGLLQLFFSGWCNQCEKSEENNGWINFNADFDARYTWEKIMQDAFYAMAPYLYDGSYVYIEPDDEHYTMKVANGTVIFED